jgi:anti-sigma B factor antagonist
VTQQPLTAALAERPTHVHEMVTTRWVGRLAVLAVCGDLDILTAPVLADAISYAAAESPTGVIVDLTDVNFLASAGMSVLVTAHEEIAAKAGFGVVADGPATSRPMRLVGLDRTITLYRTVDAALAGIDGTVTGALPV